MGIVLLPMLLWLLVPLPFYSQDSYLAICFTAIVALAILFRVYVYQYPASMIGLDPDGYAYWVQGVMETGSITAVRDSFYLKAPLFEVFPAIVGLLAGVDAPTAMVVYPALTGLLFPLTALLIVRKLTTDTWSKVAVVAAAIAGFCKMSVVLSYQPIAQTFGVLQWCILLVLLMGYVETRDSRRIVPIVLLFVAAIFTHKLPPTLIVALSVAFSSMVIVINGLEKRGWPILNYKKGISTDRVVLTVSLLSLILYIQYFHVGGLGLRMINRVIFLLQSGSESALYTPPPSYHNAVQVQNTVASILLRRGHGLVLLPLGGISGLILVVANGRDDTVFAFSAAVVASLFIVASLVDPSIGGVGRSLYVAEPVLAALASVCFLRLIPSLLDSDRKRMVLISVGAVLVGFIIIAQIASVTTALPDRPTNYRMYLTDDELAGKQFANEYVSGDISTDSYYASESTIRSISRHEDHEYQRLRLGFLFNSNMSTLEYRHILIRPDVYLYRSSNGIFRITWDVDQRLSSEYHKVYTNGDSVIFDRGKKRVLS
ncbi:hypothetical protein [Halocatena pleomorpha]|uniref:Glycosyltransferase RgtA/B/C/D-like domain-containing protein n=1 Tax=Halocatena pleomorpha TaxID=1785090 RepID=A0A3P3R7X9_9EURY|nr:hypothetical protein [Halocatena pleomorpha]RRJ29475.1 hypothetical protein EIK79_12605 [Halocatena pleomorpha]